MATLPSQVAATAGSLPLLRVPHTPQLLLFIRLPSISHPPTRLFGILLAFDRWVVQFKTVCINRRISCVLNLIRPRRVH